MQSDEVSVGHLLMPISLCPSNSILERDDVGTKCTDIVAENQKCWQLWSHIKKKKMNFPTSTYEHMKTVC